MTQIALTVIMTVDEDATLTEEQIRQAALGCVREAIDWEYDNGFRHTAAMHPDLSFNRPEVTIGGPPGEITIDDDDDIVELAINGRRVGCVFTTASGHDALRIDHPARDDSALLTVWFPADGSVVVQRGDRGPINYYRGDPLV